MFSRLAFLGLAVFAFSGPVARSEQPERLEKLYILQVFDTNDEALKLSLLQDEKRMTGFWTSAIPAKRREIITLKGDDVSPGPISQAIRGLKKKVTPKDGLAFYFGGHGALVTKGGKTAHHLQLSCGRDIERGSLRKVLQGCNAGLTVLLTDCCSTREKYDGEKQKDVAGRPGEIPPVVDSLFFRSRGLVDITAATEEEAWSDDINGGLFTQTLVRLLRAKPASLGGNDADGVTWDKFFHHLQKDTQAFFKSWSKDMKARYGPGAIRAETQKPHAFFLGQSSAQAYHAVELENKRDTALVYKFRWKGESEWTEFRLEPGKSFCHSRMASPSGEPVPLEILREGATKENVLKSQVWDKDTAPKLEFKYVVSRKK
jgi:hypothetical protein